MNKGVWAWGLTGHLFLRCSGWIQCPSNCTTITFPEAGCLIRAKVGCVESWNVNTTGDLIKMPYVVIKEAFTQ
jgi:hypothetical protein